MSVAINFLGASGTVTGSRYLIEGRRENGTCSRIMIDAGLFQGDRSWREKNWAALDSKLLSSVDACLITHAHIDHIGLLPRLSKYGLTCPVYATPPTQALAQILLPDSAMLQEEEAEYRGARGKSRHHPPLPLYTRQDAANALKLFKTVPFGTKVELPGGCRAEWRHNGHILGSASILLEIGGRTIAFSGDVGRYGAPIMKDPEPLPASDLLLIESTYGDREHGIAEETRKHFAEVINDTYRRNGVLVIPSFAVGRTQLLLYYIRELKAERTIPDLPVVVDSPSADDATAVYARFPGDYDEDALKIISRGAKPFSFNRLFFSKKREESMALNGIKDPMIIISASGMLTGGRILHHLKQRLPHPENAILFVGHQPDGGRGAWIKSGAPTVRIFKEEIPIRAKVHELAGCSAHADRAELLRWCRSFSGRPHKVAVVHGEPESAARFAATLKAELDFDTFTASYEQRIEI